MGETVKFQLSKSLASVTIEDVQDAEEYANLYFLKKNDI